MVGWSLRLFTAYTRYGVRFQLWNALYTGSGLTTSWHSVGSHRYERLRSGGCTPEWSRPTARCKSARRYTTCKLIVKVDHRTIENISLNRFHRSCNVIIFGIIYLGIIRLVMYSCTLVLGRYIACKYRDQIPKSTQPKSGIGLSFRPELDLLHSYSYRILLVSGCRLRRCLPHAAPGFADRSLDFSSRTIERLI